MRMNDTKSIEVTVKISLQVPGDVDNDSISIHNLTATFSDTDGRIEDAEIVAYETVQVEELE